MSDHVTNGEYQKWQTERFRWVVRIFFPPARFCALEQVTRECVHACLPVGHYFPSVRVFQDLSRQSQGCPDPVTGDHPAPNRGSLQASRHPFLPTFLQRLQDVKELASNPTLIRKKNIVFQRLDAQSENYPVIIFQEPTEAFKKAE